jgi:hypothetical protein
MPDHGHSQSAGCPLLVETSQYRTKEGTLRVHRDADTLDVEIDELANTTKFHVRLMTDLIGKKIVETASGLMVFKATGNAALRSSALVAYVMTSNGMEKYPEHIEVELDCSRFVRCCCEEESELSDTSD